MPAPERLFAYLDIEHPMVAWEVAIGRVQSVNDITGLEFGISLWSYGLLEGYVQGRKPNRFSNELRLESIRSHHFPDKVSRLQGLYFFRSESDVNAALDRWNMREKKQHISEILFYPTALTEVDSEWITFNLGSNQDEEWMHNYWKGTTAGATPLIEVLGNGTGVVLNEDLRIRAYKRIYELWPTATPLLAAACCAFNRRGLTDVAVAKPGLSSKGGVIEGKFYIYMGQFNERQPDIVAAMEESKRSGDCPPIIMPSDQSKIFSLPDLHPYSFQMHDPESQAVFAAIHKQRTSS